MMHLTSTVVGSSQANRQDSCKDKRKQVPPYWALPPRSHMPAGPSRCQGWLGAGSRGTENHQAQKRGKPPASELRNMANTIHSIP